MCFRLRSGMSKRSESPNYLQRSEVGLKIARRSTDSVVIPMGEWWDGAFPLPSEMNSQSFPDIRPEASVARPSA